MRLIACVLVFALLVSAARRPLKLPAKIDAGASCSCSNVQLVRREIYGGFPANAPFVRASFGFYNTTYNNYPACGYVYFTVNGVASGRSGLPNEMAGCSEGQPVMYLPFNTTFQASLDVINSATFIAFSFNVSSGEGYFGEESNL